MNLTVAPYDPSLQGAWDSFVEASKNGTFLFLRRYMDYHSDRFRDNSLLVYGDGKLLALLPANRSGEEIHSHQGLSYGGLLTGPAMTTPIMLQVFDAVVDALRREGLRRLVYKTIPYIYHGLPADEDRFALFQSGGTIYRRDVLTVVPAGGGGTVQSRRRRGAAKAGKLGVTVAKSDRWERFWPVLAETLMERYGSTPVHSLAEIRLLHCHFPRNIHLYEAALGDEVLAGTVIYESDNAAHVQYIASSPRGREVGALDLLFFFLLQEVYPAKRYFDFGASNGVEGAGLNQGLMEQKEGFGARAVAHDFYELRL